MMTGPIKIVAWLLLLSIIVLSVVPPTFRPITVLPHGIEHLTMFSATGLAFGSVYAFRYRRTITLVSLAAGFAAGIELLSYFSLAAMPASATLSWTRSDYALELSSANPQSQPTPRLLGSQPGTSQWSLRV
jgi:hypothetical protein